MWKAAIRAVKTSDDNWIEHNRKAFRHFFSSENEKPAGKLSENALRHHYQEGLFKIFLGKNYRGSAISLNKGSKYIENATVLDPNWGWLLAIGTGGAYFADYIKPEIARHYFSPEEALVAGSGKPNGVAVKTTKNKWLVNGSWSYCSGSEQATLFTAVTSKKGKISAFILPVEQAQIKRDWNAPGLDLTCSHTLIAENAEIPRDHFFDLMQDPRPSDYPISTFPFMLFARVCFVPVMVGTARAFLMEAEHYLQMKKTVWKEFQPERFEFVRNRLKENTGLINGMSSEFYQLVELSWKGHLEGKDIYEAEVSQKGLSLAEFCYNTSAAIIPKLGMAVLEQEQPLWQLWQDMQTAYQHMAFHRY